MTLDYITLLREKQSRILPCPFCGEQAEWEFTPWDDATETGDDGTGWIECHGCRVQMFSIDMDDGIEKWNRRINSQAPLAQESTDATMTPADRQRSSNPAHATIPR